MADAKTSALPENTTPASTVVIPAMSADGLNDYRIPYSTIQAAITAAVAAVLDGAPGALDTLNELAAALADDANYSATITAALAAKAADSAVVHDTGDETIAGVKTFSSSPVVPQPPTTNGQAAPKSYVDDEILDLPDLIDGAEVTWDDTTTPGSIFPVLGPGLVRTLNIPTPAAAGVSGTTAATSLLSATFTPPAGSVAVGDMLMFEAWGTAANTSVADPTVTIRLRYAAQNLLAFGSATLPLDAATRGWSFRVATLVTSTGGGNLSGPTGTLLIGPSALSGNNNIVTRTGFGLGLTIDLGSMGAFDLTAQHSSNSADIDTVLTGLFVTRFRAP